MFNSWLIMNHKRFLVIAILFLKLVQINRKSAEKVFQRRHSNVQIKSQGYPMIVAEWKAEPSRMGTPVIHTHLILLQIAIRMIVNLAFDPSLPAMVYIEKRTVRTTLKVGGTFFQVHIAIHHKSAIKNFVGCHGSLAALVKKLQDNAILSFNDIFNI